MEAHCRVYFLDADRKPVVFITVQIISLNAQQGHPFLSFRPPIVRAVPTATACRLALVIKPVPKATDLNVCGGVSAKQRVLHSELQLAKKLAVVRDSIATAV
jgi:hypothetical protein